MNKCVAARYIFAFCICSISLSIFNKMYRIGGVEGFLHFNAAQFIHVLSFQFIFALHMPSNRTSSIFPFGMDFALVYRVLSQHSLLLFVIHFKSWFKALLMYHRLYLRFSFISLHRRFNISVCILFRCSY